MNGNDNDGVDNKRDSDTGTGSIRKGINSTTASPRNDSVPSSSKRHVSSAAQQEQQEQQHQQQRGQQPPQQQESRKSRKQQRFYFYFIFILLIGITTLRTVYKSNSIYLDLVHLEDIWDTEATTTSTDAHDHVTTRTTTTTPSSFDTSLWENHSKRKEFVKNNISTSISRDTISGTNGINNNNYYNMTRNNNSGQIPTQQEQQQHESQQHKQREEISTPPREKQEQKEAAAEESNGLVLNHFLSHIPKAGGTYAFSALMLLLRSSDQWQNASREERQRPCDIATKNIRTFFTDNEKFPKDYLGISCTLYMSESYWTDKVKHVYTILRKPKSHVLSQYFHCTESIPHKRRARFMPKTLDAWLETWVSVMRQEQKVQQQQQQASRHGQPKRTSTATITTTTKKNDNNDGDIALLSKMKEKAKSFQCYNPINLQSRYSGLPTIPSTETSPIINDSSNKTTAPSSTFTASSSFLNLPHVSKELLKSRYTVVGINEYMVESVCSIFIRYLGYVPWQCNCKDRTVNGTASATGGSGGGGATQSTMTTTVSSSIVSQRRRRLQQQFNTSQPRRRRRTQQQQMEQQKQQEQQSSPLSSTTTTPRKAANFQINDRKHSHGVIHHGSSYNTTKYQDQLISQLVSLDEILYTIANETFWEQVDEIQKEYDTVLSFVINSQKHKSILLLKKSHTN